MSTTYGDVEHVLAEIITEATGEPRVGRLEELVAFEFGSYKLEHQRHREFAHARITGEWFARDDVELTAWIDNLRCGIEDLTDVPRSATRAVKRRILGLDAA